MPAPTTIAEWIEDYAPSVAAPGSVADRAVRRAFMQGALAVLKLQSDGQGVDQLVAECIAYGRTIGTAAERATLTKPHLLQKGPR